MFLYILLGIIIFIYVLFENRNVYSDGDISTSKISIKLNSKIKGNLFFFVIWLFLFFLTAFRAESIGNDTANYVLFFEELKDGVFDSNLEIGYSYLCYGIGFITKDPHVFLIILAGIDYYLLGHYILKYCHNKSIVLCLFYAIFFPFFMSVMRQGLAMIIVLYAYNYLKKNKKIIFIFLILVACLFHKSAFVGIFLFFYKFVPKKLFVVICISIVVFLLCISGIITPVIEKIVSPFYNYFNKEQAGTGWLAITYSFIRAVIFTIVSFQTATKVLNFKESKLIKTNAFLLLMSISFGYLVNIFDRISDYFLLIFIFDTSLYTSRLKKNKLTNTLICLVSLAYFWLSLALKPEWNHIIPYEFWR